MSKRRNPRNLDPVKTVIQNLSHEGRGITSLNDKKIFVAYALPQEEVTFKYIKCHSKYDEAKALEIHSTHEKRVEPQCPHFTVCGGCSMQHIDLDFQREHKQAILLDHLKHLSNIEPQEIFKPLTALSYGYRRKARMGAKYVIKKESVLVGFREAKSPYLADMHQCEVLHPNVGHRIDDLRELIANMHAKEKIAQIEVAMGDTQTALVFRNLVELDEHDIDLLKQFSDKFNFQVYLQPGNNDSVYKLWPNDKQELLSYQHKDFNLTLNFHPLDFTQVNSEINQQMVPRALELLDIQKDERVLDLFCGLGNFTLPIATLAKQVVGIEGDERMVKRASDNATFNNITNAEFYAADLSKDIGDNTWAQQDYDKILLDPPRTGAKELCEFIGTKNVKRIVYVSCNSSTLARDAGLLAEQGYTLTKCGIMDMFPHTAHVEAIAVFDKN